MKIKKIVGFILALTVCCTYIDGISITNEKVLSNTNNIYSVTIRVQSGYKMNSIFVVDTNNFLTDTYNQTTGQIVIPKTSLTNDGSHLSEPSFFY